MSIVEGVDLLGIATELYALTPAEFTAARNGRAKEAAATGDRELAQQVRTLPKPSASAWVVNRLADEAARTEFGKLGADLRNAQSRADRQVLTRLLGQRKTLLAKATKSAKKVALDHGVALSAAALGEVEQTLQAALADEDGFAAAFSGRLVRPVRSDGLEPVDLAGAIGGPELRTSSATRRSSGSRQASGSSRTAAAKKAADAAISRALRVAAEADASLHRVEKDLDALAADAAALDHDVADLQAKFDRLEERRRELDDRRATLNRDRARARDAALRAHRSADAAQAKK